MSYSFTLTDIIPAPPAAVYDAWLHSRGHTEMTGSKATQSPRIGAKVSAWGGYISGQNLELVPGRRIVQSWRTTQFTDADPDSKISVTLRAVPGGTRVTLHHSRVPDGHTSYERGGWQDHYFKPMKAYFTKQAGRLVRKYSGSKKPRRKVGAAARSKAVTGRAKTVNRAKAVRRSKAVGRKPPRSLSPRPRRTRRPARRR
jgi:uncharacterized protein YndB with AHSA1/START domain